MILNRLLKALLRKNKDKFTIICPKCGGRETDVAYEYDVEEGVIKGIMIIFQCKNEKCGYAEGFK